MNKTSNYQLNQWAKSDQVRMEDFNADNAKIDAALGGLAQGKADKTALAALTQTVAAKGNCNILTGSYVGTGDYGVTLTLGVLPKLVIVTGGAELVAFMYGQTETALLSHDISYSINITWTENGLSWRCSRSMVILNNEGRTYNYVVFY